MRWRGGTRILGKIAQRYNGYHSKRFSDQLSVSCPLTTMAKPMDCSSQYAMAGLIAQDQFDIAFGSDRFRSSWDCHPVCRIDESDHYLAVAIRVLIHNSIAMSMPCQNQQTLVSSSMINRVAERVGRQVYEVPVGFKWFVRTFQQGLDLAARKVLGIIVIQCRFLTTDRMA